MKLKLLGAALLALAATAPAYADIAQTTTGNGELFLSVWDTMGTVSDSDDVSYTLDLGTSLNSFISSPGSPVAPVPVAGMVTDGLSVTWSADPLLTSFLATASSLNNLQWNVMAGDGVGMHRMMMTVSSSFAGDSNKTTTEFRGWDGQMDSYLIAVNALDANAADNLTSNNNSVVATAADGAALASGVAFGPSIGGKLDFTTTGGIGDSLNTWVFYENTTTATEVREFQLASTGGTAATWTLGANGNLTYAVAAPVPEADTYALLLAGLGLVGFMARRRKLA